MNPAFLLERLRALGIEVLVDGHELSVRGPQRALDDQPIEELRAQKPALLALLEQRCQPGVIYKLPHSQSIEHIYQSPPGLREWADDNDHPRAGIVSVDGQVILIADVAESLRDDVVDFLGVAPEGWATPSSSLARPQCRHLRDWVTEETREGSNARLWPLPDERGHGGERRR